MTEQSTTRTAQQIHEDPVYQRLEQAMQRIATDSNDQLEQGVSAEQDAANNFAALGIPIDVIEHFVQDRMALSWRQFTDAISAGEKINDAMPGINGATFADGILIGYAFANNESASSADA